MTDDPKAGPVWPEAGDGAAGADGPEAAGSDAAPSSPPAGWTSSPAAIYGLEHALVCPSCFAEIDQVFVLRLFRTRVNFMSSLPRSGRVLACPKCRAILPGELGAVF